MSDLERGLRELITDIVRGEVDRALREASPAAALLSTRDAAKYAGVVPDTVRRWIREGKLPEQRAGRVVRIARADLERLLREGVRKHDDLSPEAMALRDFG